MELMLALCTVFLAAAFFAGGTALWVFSSAAERRLRRALESSTSVLFVRPENRGAAADRNRRSGFLAMSAAELAAARSRLARAGFRQPSAATVYSACEKLSVVLVGLPPLLLLNGRTAWILAALGGLIGFFVPGFVLDHLVTSRRNEIASGLPDALDLFVLCLEAGVSLNQAIVRATEELQISYPVLAEEFQIVITEIRAGKPRLEALKGLEKRTKVDDVRALVSMLAQTERFGTSVAQALRTMANVARTKRRQLAEERAGKLGVKLVFPLVLLIFPAIFVVVLGPAAIKVVHAFSH